MLYEPPLEPPDRRDECTEKVDEWALMESAGLNPVYDEFKPVADEHGPVDCPCCKGSGEHVWVERFYPCVCCKGKGGFRFDPLPVGVNPPTTAGAITGPAN